MRIRQTIAALSRCGYFLYKLSELSSLASVSVKLDCQNQPRRCIPTTLISVQIERT